MHYAIAIVPPSWESDHSLGFSSSSYEAWHEKIEPGTRVLIYKDEPVNAIIAEAVVQDDAFIPLANLPEENRSRLLTSDGQQADYALPLRITFIYPQRHYVPQEQLAEFVSEKKLNGWIPINDETYRALSEPNNVNTTEQGS
jgi:hypothetical protein